MNNKKAVETAATVSMALTEKELYCLAWHYNAFYEQFKQKLLANWAYPCGVCKYVNECYTNGNEPIVYEMEKKLPVQITHHKHFKDIFSYGEGSI